MCLQMELQILPAKVYGSHYVMQVLSFMTPLDDNLLSKAHFQDFLRAQIYAIHNATNYIYVY